MRQQLKCLSVKTPESSLRQLDYRIMYLPATGRWAIIAFHVNVASEEGEMVNGSYTTE